MALPATEAFGAAAANLPNPPWTQQRTTRRVNTDGSGHGTQDADDAAGDVLAFWNADTFGADQYSQIQINSLVVGGGGCSANASVRASASGDAAWNAYDWYTNLVSGAGNTELAKVVSGVATVLRNYATTFVASDTVRLQVVGQVLTAFKNGVSIGTQSDAALSSGSPGCGTFRNGATVTIDNFQADNLVVASAAMFSTGTRMAPGQRGPFDRLGFIASPYQRYSYVSSVSTFLVSSADGFTIYESLDGANALVSAAVQEESVASVAQAQAIIEEALASLSQSATVQTEAQQGLALVQAVIEESLASAAIAAVVQEEALASASLAATVRDEANASAALAAAVQDESLASASIGQTVIEEALASASLSTTARYEALATALLASIVQYEAGGVASSPVSNSAVVTLESLSSVASSPSVQAEATRTIAALLTIILESGGLTNGPMAGINAIVFAAMVTLAALDLMTTVATSDSLATSATLDTLATGAASDSLITRSVFDG